MDILTIIAIYVSMHTNKYWEFRNDHLIDKNRRETKELRKKNKHILRILHMEIKELPDHVKR